MGHAISCPCRRTANCVYGGIGRHPNDRLERCGSSPHPERRIPTYPSADAEAWQTGAPNALLGASWKCCNSSQSCSCSEWYVKVLREWSHAMPAIDEYRISVVSPGDSESLR